jgi:hydroxymethylpyrimidine/phosphomethylpyrimidine kinase
LTAFIPETVIHTPRALTIAGSDSGGGAGIQADLKAFARCGVYGMSAITAITAQNTRGVSAVHSLAPDMILAQVRAVIGDIGVDVVKVGMLGTVEAAHAVARALDELPTGTPVVVDPVMVAESGARLLDPDAQEALVTEILPRATILTPNLPEAHALARHAACTTRSAAVTGMSGSGRGEGVPAGGEVEHDEKVSAGGEDDEEAEAVAVARAVLSLGPKIVVLTGGHRAQATDLFLDSATPEQIVSIPGERHPDGAAHGSGCTHSSLLAAQLALGRSPLQAARLARTLTGEAVANGLRDVGGGPGPVDVIGLASLRQPKD